MVTKILIETNSCPTVRLIFKNTPLSPVWPEQSFIGPFFSVHYIYGIRPNIIDVIATIVTLKQWSKQILEQSRHPYNRIIVGISLSLSVTLAYCTSFSPKIQMWNRYPRSWKNLYRPHFKYPLCWNHLQTASYSSLICGNRDFQFIFSQLVASVFSSVLTAHSSISWCEYNYLSYINFHRTPKFGSRIGHVYTVFA